MRNTVIIFLFLAYGHETMAQSDSVPATPSEQPVVSDVSTLAPPFTDYTENRVNRALHFALELGVWGSSSAW
ncbi:uncharacterized protein METZ01_LOCUS184652, partial [marine metagenome]